MSSSHPVPECRRSLPRLSRLERQDGRIGRVVFYLPEVDSTNRLLANLAGRRAEAGTVVVADHQTAGRGKEERVWYSAPGTGLSLSVLLRPRVSIECMSQATLMISVAVADAIEAASGVAAEIKWPNDIMAGGRKLCGILCELVTTPDGDVDHIIAGIGINVSQTPDQFPDGLRSIATSIEAEAKRAVDRQTVLSLLLDRLEHRLAQWERDGFQPIRRDWIRRSCTLGRPIIVTTPQERRSGTAIALGDDGSLSIRTEEGSIHNYIFGETCSSSVAAEKTRN
ncbi:biotin--[acetyl-CoA-carboxylase] ligase [Rhodobium orientis]|uniref:biotin--[biotin carboxyl-carrier protein] ligase n=1 Tax=Rhodobium orientis TaxID=34017 RepID=A0A327JUB4_9HYPH|nr:biotin--[acetyl-CoA-carboxylase] ligase [Rhodobium orientis]MBK5951804.1 biotin--[acetyl-CoA-carboxylase] ligase [Rhodobium orientis]RAI28522.1 biotin--[acetyl-CoA-carboxylase] ligase [Rhodobium orientis]